MSSKQLTPKQQLFVDAYLATGNRAEAARRSGTPAKSAWNQAYRMMRNDEVLAAIEERLKENAMSADEVIARLTDQARSDLSDLYQVAKDGSIRLDFGSPEALRAKHLIKKLRTRSETRIEGQGKNARPVTVTTIEVELHDAQHALEVLARYHKLLGDEQTVHAHLTIEDFDRALEKAYGARAKE